MPFARSDPSDPIWTAVPFASDGTGCGFDLGGFPGITPVGTASGADGVLHPEPLLNRS